MSLNDKNYVYGDKNSKVPAHLNFGKHVLDYMLLYKDKLALVNCDTEEKMTYKEFLQYAVNLAMALKELGVGPGSTVAVVSEKRLNLCTDLAVIFTGATVTQYEQLIGPAVLKHKLNLVKPDYLILTKAFWDKYEDILKNADHVKQFLTFDDELGDAIPINKIMPEKDVDIDLFEPVPVKGQNDVALILYSSGTTGLSKGVLLTHLNCILNTDPECFKDPELKTALVFGLWMHNYCIFMAFKFFSMGRTVAYFDDTSSENLLRIIDKYQINIQLSVPTAVASLSKVENCDKYDTSSLKILYSRSSPLHAKTMEKIKEKFPKIKSIIQGYGMTEAGELSSEVWATKGTRLGSVGMPTPGYIFKVVDLNSGKPLGPKQNGEIRIKGPVLMKGYIGVDPSSYLDEEGFLKTGDLGYYDEDGYIYIIERIKEIISHMGFKIAPLELETLLLLHPGVKEAGVVGKPAGDLDELPTAFVVKNPGSTVTEQELIDYIAGQVSTAMNLTGGVIFIDVLPRNQRGKILRSSLREMLKETSSSASENLFNIITM